MSTKITQVDLKLCLLIVCLSWLSNAPGLLGQEINLRMTLNTKATVLAISPDGRALASAGENTIKLWAVETGKENLTLTGHSDVVRCLAFSPDGNTLASGSDDRTIRLWDVRTGKHKFSLAGHTQAITCMAFSANGSELVACGGDTLVWCVGSRSKLASVESNGRVKCVAFHPNGKKIGLGGGTLGGFVGLWEIPLPCQDETAETSSELNKVPLAVPLGGLPVLPFLQGVESIDFSPDGKLLAIASSLRGQLVIAPLDGKDGYDVIVIHAGNYDSARRVVFSPDAKVVATPGGIWDVSSKKQIARLSEIGDLVFTPDGKTLVTTGKNGIRWWDVENTKIK